MVKKIFAVFFLILVPCLLLAQETKVFQGEKKSKSLADAFLLNISYAPIMPAKDFSKLSLSPDKYDNAQYRVTYARYEIYVSLNVDLIGMFEDLGRDVLSTYDVPLDTAVDFDRGIIKNIEWKSFDTFEIECTGLKPDFIATVKILPDGKFLITKK